MKIVKTLIVALALTVLSPAAQAAPSGGNAIACTSIRICVSSSGCVDSLADAGALTSTLVWYLDHC